MRANESVMRLTSMNGTLRSSMDLLVRDFLQIGSGLPPSHGISIPSGLGSTPVRIPGPPGSAFTTAAGTAQRVVIDTGPDRVSAGQLMMVTKGSLTTLVQVTAMNPVNRVLTFGAGDSLNLNQPAAAAGTLAALNASAPANATGNVRLTRIRMISYYLDNTIPGSPRLVRRVNNGHPTVFNNTLGTVVGGDVEGLRLTYDLVDGTANPSDVRFSASDVGGGGACAPNACTPNQIRKISVTLTARSSGAAEAGTTIFRNALTSQVSLRSMAFVNEYQSP
jgi:hypothetical protein